MKIHALYHVAYEKPGCILDWIKMKSHHLSETNLFLNEEIPEIDKFDMLIIMGGPMGANDDGKYPWLSHEKIMIQQAVESGKAVMGICLGAQLIAAALGSRVYPAVNKEIGWLLVYFDTSEKDIPFPVPDNRMVFHWHGDTFDLPVGAKHIASSATTPNQAFLFGDKVMAVQFHLEMKQENLAQMVRHGGHELNKDAFIQSPREIMEGTRYLPENNRLMFSWLDYLEGRLQNEI